MFTQFKYDDETTFYLAEKNELISSRFNRYIFNIRMMKKSVFIRIKKYHASLTAIYILKW